MINGNREFNVGVQIVLIIAFSQCAKVMKTIASLIISSMLSSHILQVFYDLHASSKFHIVWEYYAARKQWFSF